jgi:hypothetical protein
MVKEFKKTKKMEEEKHFLYLKVEMGIGLLNIQKHFFMVGSKFQRIYENLKD